MLGRTRAFSGFSVDDTEAARRFYGETLGLEVTDLGGGMLRLELAGGGQVLIYPKPDHQPATYTILNFPVVDLAAAMAELHGRGVEFERYDVPGLRTDADGIAEGEGPRIAWFKDPAGNILSMLEED
ncbi:VOC family protein [Catellatospora bangladeshensis]|uniref:Glyoxalase n=1 Tax=Catellatospora bangladeshensis TaxID=310355 RepID=A0A8J3JSH2_9ACTN|nr:VOC family protein [Catellatospora bangladeshensis]GIF86221.1 glyoxalase [Catellatospora bangladeshensis]